MKERAIKANWNFISVIWPLYAKCFLELLSAFWDQIWAGSLHARIPFCLAFIPQGIFIRTHHFPICIYMPSIFLSLILALRMYFPYHIQFIAHVPWVSNQYWEYTIPQRSILPIFPWSQTSYLPMMDSIPLKLSCCNKSRYSIISIKNEDIKYKRHASNQRSDNSFGLHFPNGCLTTRVHVGMR